MQIPDRLRALFQQMPTFGGNYQAPPSSNAMQDQNMMQDQNNQFNPQTNMYDELARLISSQPQPNKTSWKDKLLGFGASLGSKDPFETAQKVANRGYYNNLGRWSQDVNNYKDAAQLENSRNTNERVFQWNKLQDQSRNRQIERQENRDDELARSAREREDVAKRDQERKDRDSETRRKQQELRELIAAKPSYKGFIDKDGYVTYIDQNDPTGTPIKTDVDTTDMTPYELEKAKSQLRIGEISARGEQTRQTKKTPSALQKTSKEPSASQKARELFDKVMTIRNQDPEAASFIELGPNNTFKIKPPAFSSMRPEAKKKYDEVVKSIYGNDIPKELNQQTSQQTEKIRVKRKADGKTGTISLGAFNPELYERIE